MVKFEIVQHLADIGNKELNIVKWANNEPKLDLRKWREDDNKLCQPLRGVTLSDEEAKELYKALHLYLQTC